MIKPVWYYPTLDSHTPIPQKKCLSEDHAWVLLTLLTLLAAVVVSMGVCWIGWGPPIDAAQGTMTYAP